MAVIKCKMCGGDLEIEEGMSVAVCEYCGTKQTLPKLDDDRKANLYDRANHFRRNNDFDKAMGIYEQILNEDNTDAEAYWSIVLCRYGIEYVEDPASHKRVPTVNRAQFTSVFADEDYKSAVEHADGAQREIYEHEAKTIDEIQKGILAISQKEEPFDVFICYKETDANGRRTPDSVLATDLYHQLKQEGFKVFFSRITLEDKLGMEYEPYIFAALNSAKVMVVLGTKPEYFNAVWVKNEWSRYLALIKNGAKKVLVPAYKDMDPYDLPEEFSHLQAQDMSKLGFMQDLIRGIKKLTAKDEPKAVIKETVVINNSSEGVSSTNVAPLLKRAFMFLEDREWESADEYCEKVLDIDPENAEAYLGKLMVELRVSSRDGLRDCEETFDDRNNYRKIIRFCDDKLREKLEKDNEIIKERNYQKHLENLYSIACRSMNSAKTERDYKDAAENFKHIIDFKDSKEKIEKCFELAENARKDAIYDNGQINLVKGTIQGYATAENCFNKILGWKDSDELIVFCHESIETLKKIESTKKKAEEQNNKKKKRNSFIITAVMVIIGILALVYFFVLAPAINYKTASALMEEGKYEEAIIAFEAMNGYGDSIEQIANCKTAILDREYKSAVDYMAKKDYEKALEFFKNLNGYRDSEKRIENCKTAINEEKYVKATSLLEKEKYKEAAEIFLEIKDYKDSAEKIEYINKIIMKNCKVGDIFLFGKYEQNNDTSDGKEPIEWLVIETKNNKVLVISKNILHFKQYEESRVYKEFTWETCSLRNWLNHGFLVQAFSEDEQMIICKTTVPADKNPTYPTNPGKATKDKIFLLSVKEADEYSELLSKNPANPTKVVKEAAPSSAPDAYCWWLRTPGDSGSYSAYVGKTGMVFDGGRIQSCYYGVRPAMWIDLSAIE